MTAHIMILDTNWYRSSATFFVEYSLTKQNKPGYSIGCGSLVAKLVSRRKSWRHHQWAKQIAVGIFGLLHLSEPWLIHEIFLFLIISVTNSHFEEWFEVKCETYCGHFTNQPVVFSSKRLPYLLIPHGTFYNSFILDRSLYSYLRSPRCIMYRKFTLRYFSIQNMSKKVFVSFLFKIKTRVLSGFCIRFITARFIAGQIIAGWFIVDWFLTRSIHRRSIRHRNTSSSHSVDSSRVNLSWLDSSQGRFIAGLIHRRINVSQGWFNADLCLKTWLKRESFLLDTQNWVQFVVKTFALPLVLLKCKMFSLNIKTGLV
jgi:hypothetical protein